ASPLGERCGEWIAVLGRLAWGPHGRTQAENEVREAAASEKVSCGLHRLYYFPPLAAVRGDSRCTFMQAPEVGGALCGLQAAQAAHSEAEGSAGRTSGEAAAQVRGGAPA